MSTIILACSSVKDYVNEAQKTMHTSYPVQLIDRKYHMDPKKMQIQLITAIEKLDPEIDTVLVAMGFCGGSWDQVSFANRRIVIPRVDDCVSLMLHTDDEYHPNLKESTHLYMMEENPEDFSLKRAFEDCKKLFEGYDEDTLFHKLFDYYTQIDIVDTGLHDCYSEKYATIAQENADLINAGLDYVQGSNRLLEKLVSGRWDEQFLVAEPGHLIRHGNFF
ncbi:MAG: DUF1638 domain-containing protein [Lachnospiraceae bacterium]